VDSPLVGGIDTFGGLSVDESVQDGQQGLNHQPGRLGLDKPLGAHRLGQVIPVEELFADQQTCHVSAAQGPPMPGQQVRGGSPLGGIEEAGDVELQISTELVAAPSHHRCQAAAVAPDRIGWIDLIAPTPV
jgi:hypothetical protein